MSGGTLSMPPTLPADTGLIRVCGHRLKSGDVVCRKCGLALNLFAPQTGYGAVRLVEQIGVYSGCDGCRMYRLCNPDGGH